MVWGKENQLLNKVKLDAESDRHLSTAFILAKSLVTWAIKLSVLDAFDSYELWPIELWSLWELLLNLWSLSTFSLLKLNKLDVE